MRDPDGRVFMAGERIIRWVRAEKLADFEALLASDFLRAQVERGRIVATRRLADGDVPEGLAASLPARGDSETGPGAFFEHDAVPFVTYPFEWPAEMLKAAATLTLDLARDALAAGYRLKDATPYNVLFIGPRPVFVDLLSFEKHVPGDPLWLPEGQFLRTFLLPLLAEKRFGLACHQTLSLKRDGIDVEMLYPMASRLARLSPLFLRYVSLPIWLSSRAENPEVYAQRLLKDDNRARFVLERVFDRLQRACDRLAPRTQASSHWSNYMTDNSYSEAEFAQKEAFINTALQDGTSARVLDIGANTGHFSGLAAASGASVVAADFDPRSVGAIWHTAGGKGHDILPMTLDVADPSPARGWCNGETRSFLDRSTGRFDMVMMLALIHHLTLTNGIPIEEVVELGARLTTRHCIIEYVGAEDPMRKRIRRGRLEIDAAITRDRFEAACARHFDTVTSQQLGSADRWMYHLALKH